METIKVAFGFDEDYSIHGLVTSLSLLDSALKKGEQSKYDLFFLSEMELSEETKGMFFDYLGRYSNLQQIRFFSAARKFEEKYVSKHLSKATYLRLEIPELIEERRVIYSDVDVIYLSGLGDLWKVDVRDFYLAAVVDVGLNQERKFERKRSQLPYWGRYFDERRGTYFQAGLLLMNLDEIRKDGLYDKWKALSREKFEQHDMDIINITCFPKIKKIGSEYAVIPRYFLKRGYELGVKEGFLDLCELRNVYEAPVLIHYAGPDKPWSFPSVPGSHEYWSFVRKFPKVEKELKKRYSWSLKDRLKTLFVRPLF